ncbi:serine hydrolase domain-containing protein [Nonomuraea cavernae]|uniref:Esterase n=1 Tax=Nonomuraea cavernae TaxID=2045107 RepID=A0A918DEZ7_9ACTN|nr:serine hydrolase domain-containing protein [Nonomuraea cavernae]MCA2184623.1 beta-lactamase family protein [Nonomuraea cavernae]GGO63236.1 esterase [Nonomuraea cavernae]
MALHDKIAQLLDGGVRDQVFPGAVWGMGDADDLTDAGVCGLADPADPATAMQLDTVFDVASLTKIVAVWAVIGSLWEEQRLSLDDAMAALLPELADYPLGQVTVRQLLTHTAGVPLRANLRALYGTDPRAIEDGVLQEALHQQPGQAVEYTDRAALILGFLAKRLTGTSLDRLAETRIWHPLGMRNTCFGPLPQSAAARCAPTEYDEATGAHLKGVAHDYSARLLGGVCGIAGVFSVLSDLARFQQHLLAPGIAGPAGFGAAWIKESLQVHTGELTPPRGLFWYPADSADDHVYVHYGFTGTGMWISPKGDRWAVLLTNKIHYSRKRGPLMDIRNAFRALVFD